MPATSNAHLKSIEPLECRIAPASFAGSVSAVFDSPDGGVTTGVGTSQFTWGSGVNGSGPNSFTFSAESFDVKNANVFSLGHLDYFNGTISIGTEANSVDLNLTFNFDKPARAAVQNESYTLHMTSTPNTDDPIASADYVDLGSGQRLVFTVGRATYTMEILGFGSVGDGVSTYQVSREFHVQEGSSDSADLLARFTPVDLIAKQVKWDSHEGGLTFKYEIKGDSLRADQTLPLDLFWSTSPSVEDRLSGIDVSSLTLDTTVGMHKLHIPGALLLNAPQDATHIVAALDYMDVIVEIDEKDNGQGIADVELTRGPKATGTLSDYSTNVLKELLRQAGEPSAEISSLQRTASDQARIMFDNAFHNGVQDQYDQYAPPGDSVIDVYVELTHGLSRREIREQRSTIEQAMLDQINAVGPTSVSHHCADPDVLQVIDLAPSSFSTGSRALFPDLARGDGRVSQFLDPSKHDKAFHIEIGQI